MAVLPEAQAIADDVSAVSVLREWVVSFTLDVQAIRSELHGLHDKLDALRDAAVTQKACSDCQQRWMTRRQAGVAVGVFTGLGIVAGILGTLTDLLGKFGIKITGG